MKITFISNFHNHHQMPLCDAFMKIPGIEFSFIATENVPEDRIKLGYKHDFTHLPYYSEAISPADGEKAEQMCFESDVVIIGSAPIRLVRRRLRARKLTFSYNERWFKEGFWEHPGDVYRALRDFTCFNNPNFYQLCAGAYAASDSRRVLAFPGRKLRWGYFPEVKQHEIGKLMARKKKNSILWAGRFLDWKHPEKAVKVAAQLKREDIDFELNILGSGEMKYVIKEMIHTLGLGDCVHLLGSMSPEEVRRHMECSRIFLFTSDFAEGWGAVLNEAMNSGCAVVASHAIGAAPFLIRHGENGYIYENGDDEALYRYVTELLLDRSVSDRFGINAYCTMAEQWNGDIAANRLYAFCEAKLAGKDVPFFEEGPVSKAPVRIYGQEKSESRQ